jgi:hypothetical protein
MSIGDWQLRVALVVNPTPDIGEWQFAQPPVRSAWRPGSSCSIVRGPTMALVMAGLGAGEAQAMWVSGMPARRIQQPKQSAACQDRQCEGRPQSLSRGGDSAT